MRRILPRVVRPGDVSQRNGHHDHHQGDEDTYIFAKICACLIESTSTVLVIHEDKRERNNKRHFEKYRNSRDGLISESASLHQPPFFNPPLLLRATIWATGRREKK